MIAWRLVTAEEDPWLDWFAENDSMSGFMQSGFWADFKRIEGYEVIRLICERDGEPIGGASLLHFKLTNEPGFVLCPEGPLLPWEDVTVARDALRQLTAFVEMMPDVLGLRIEPHLPAPLPSLLRNWGDAPTDLTPADTLLLNIRLPEEDLLAQAHPKCRYNLRIADRDGVEVSVYQDTRLAHDFYELLTETSVRTGFFVEPLGFFLNLMTILFAEDAGELLVARRDGKMLAAILVVYFGMRATYLYGASSSSGRNHMPAYPLHREAMRRARERGCLEYDMYGIDADERRDHLYAGITRFKKQWGGQVVRRIGARDYVFYGRLADLIVERLAGPDQPGG